MKTPMKNKLFPWLLTGILSAGAYGQVTGSPGSSASTMGTGSNSSVGTKAASDQSVTTGILNTRPDGTSSISTQPSSVNQLDRSLDSKVTLTGKTQNADRIRQAQSALHDKGYNVGSVDGVNGSQTQSAIRDFQRSRGLAPSGTLDEATMRAMGLMDTQTVPDRERGIASPPGTPSDDDLIDEAGEDQMNRGMLNGDQGAFPEGSSDRITE